jgi:hypothetical protein
MPYWWHPHVSEIPMAYFQAVKIIMAYFHLTLSFIPLRYTVTAGSGINILVGKKPLWREDVHKSLQKSTSGAWQRWHQLMERRAGCATSTSNLNLYEYLVLFFNVLPNFTLKHFYFVKYPFKVRLKIYTSFKII